MDRCQDFWIGNELVSNSIKAEAAYVQMLDLTDTGDLDDLFRLDDSIKPNEQD